MLKSSVLEVNQKLLIVDKCLSGLTNLVTALIKASSNPMTTEATLLLQTVDDICGNKREAIIIDSPAMDHKRIRLRRDTSRDGGDFGWHGRCCTDDSYDTNSTSSETLGNCEVKTTPSEFHTDNDFDKFLAFIADDEQHVCYETSPSDPGMVLTESMLASAYPALVAESVHITVTTVIKPFNPDHFPRSHCVFSKVPPLQP
jgi:hypothetical protein